LYVFVDRRLKSQLRLAGAFQCEQILLGLQPTGKPGQPTRGANDPMARCNDRDGITPIGRTHGAYGFWVTDLLGDLTVAAGFAKGDGQQCLPDR
jgi:hypothetical protein